MSTQPTDAEIDALWRFEASKNWDNTLAMQTSFTRAVLAKWGPPAPARPDSVLEDAERESEYRRGYRHGYEQRDAEVRGALA